MIRALLVAGTPDGQIYRSTDGGQGWVCDVEGLNPILALAGDAATLYAGLYDDGLLLSDDGGVTWRNDSSLAARDITRLLGEAGVSAQYAYGPTGGLWRATDAGWQRIDGFESDGVLASVVAAGPGQLLAAVEGALFRSDDGGARWDAAPLPSDEQILVHGRWINARRCLDRRRGGRFVALGGWRAQLGAGRDCRRWTTAGGAGPRWYGRTCRRHLRCGAGPRRRLALGRCRSQLGELAGAAD